MMKSLAFLLGYALFPLFLLAQTETSFTAADTARARELLELAQRQIDSARYDAALGNLETAGEMYKAAVGEESVEWARVLQQKARGLLRIKNYDLASKYVQLSLTILLKQSDTAQDDLSASYHILGDIYHHKGNFDSAIENYRNSLNIRIKQYGEKHLDIATLYRSLALISESKGEFKQALEFYQKSLDIRVKILGDTHPQIGDSYERLGAINARIGNFEQAVDFEKKAISIFYKNSDENNPLVASAYNILAIIHGINREYKESLMYLQNALNIQLKTLDTLDQDIAQTYNNLGNVYEETGDYNQAIKFHNKALEIQLVVLGNYNGHTASTYYNLGDIYIAKEDYKKAIDNLEKALTIQVKIYGKYHRHVANTFNSLGIAFNHTGEYGKAIEFYSTSLEINTRLLPPNHPYIANNFVNLGSTHAEMGNFDSIKEYYEKALDIYIKSVGSVHRYVANTYINLGELYGYMKRYDLAIENFQKGLEVYIKLHGSDKHETAMCYASLGLGYMYKGENDMAIENLQKANSIWLKSVETYNNRIGQTFCEIAHVYQRKGKFSEGEQYLKQAFHLLNFSSRRRLYSVNSIQILINALNRNIHFYRNWYSQSHNINHLHTARQSYLEADAAIAYQRRQLDNPGSKTMLARETKGVYEGAIAVGNTLYHRTDSLHYLHEAFGYAEKSKALLLYESIKEADALHYAGIPDSLLQREYDLRVDICYYDKKRRELMSEKQLPETDTSVLAVSGKLFDLNREYEALKSRFENDYLDYYRLKYDISTTSIETLQSEVLQAGQTLLEYVVGDSSIFLFVVGRQTFRLIEIKKDFPLENWVSRLRRMLADSVNTGPAIYCDLAHRLWQKLLLPAQDLLTETLIIVPDGVLGYLPFEVLLTEAVSNPVRFQQHPYLLRSHRVSYSYSATLLREQLQKQHRQPPTGSVLALAPFFRGDVQELSARMDTTDLLSVRTTSDSLRALPASGEEAAAVAKLWKGTPLYAEAATLGAFRDQADRYRLLHLSTHGQADDRGGDYAFLAFSATDGDAQTFDKLYARDLYNLRLNADLVVLSACETGTGKLERGEGIISLARAFAYAGAKSIVTSMWKVTDAPTKNLMLGFYRRLKKGLPKDEALRQAKLEYLGKADPRLAHPYYWAGFVGVGDMRAIDH